MWLFLRSQPMEGLSSLCCPVSTVRLGSNFRMQGKGRNLTGKFVCRSTCVLRGAGGFSPSTSSPSTSGRGSSASGNSAKGSVPSKSGTQMASRVPDFVHEESTAPSQVRRCNHFHHNVSTGLCRLLGRSFGRHFEGGVSAFPKAF